jgi:hypothetical protein
MLELVIHNWIRAKELKKMLELIIPRTIDLS